MGAHMHVWWGRVFFGFIHLLGRGQAELYAVHDSRGVRVVTAGALRNFFSDLRNVAQGWFAGKENEEEQVSS